MCLITKQKEPIILEKDLTVYKYVRIKKANDGEKLKENQYKNWLYWEHQFIYTLGKLHKQEMVADGKYKSEFDGNVGKHYITQELGRDGLKKASPSNYYGNIQHSEFFKSRDFTHVHEGFHAATKLERLSFDRPGSIIMECKIPKGAEVYFDETDLVVSNKIIILNEIKK